MSSERWFTVAEAADALRTHPETVREWLRRGLLRGTLISRRAGWRIAQSELDRFLSEGPRVPEGKLAA